MTFGQLRAQTNVGLWHHFNTWITFYMQGFPFELKITTNYVQEWLANGWFCWRKALLHPPCFFKHKIWVVPQLSHLPLSLSLFQSQMYWSHFMTTESAWFKKLRFFLLMPLAFLCFYWASGCPDQCVKENEIAVPLKSLEASKRISSRFSSNLNVEIYHGLWSVLLLPKILKLI